MNKVRALQQVGEELVKAQKKFPAFMSMHEGIAIIREEYLELEAEVFKEREDMIQLRKEAKQLGAMALRFLVDCCPDLEDVR